MKKSHLFVFILSMLCMFLVGCGETPLSVTTSTTSTVYDFYTNELLASQEKILTEISQTNFTDEGHESRVGVFDNMDLLSCEESMVLAGVQCFNLVSQNKEIYVDYNGSVINVSGVGNSFVCTVVDENGQTLNEYTLTISRNNNTYIINYNKTTGGQSHACVANVEFDQSTSYLSMDVSSVTEDGSSARIRKVFYSLANEQEALQVELSINSYCYEARYFEEAQKCKLKLSRRERIGDSVTLPQLSLDVFCEANGDICGYSIEGVPLDETTAGVINQSLVIGTLSEW